MNQLKWFRQNKFVLKNDICDIIKEYVNGETDYTRFSYKISPHIYNVCDGKITNPEIKEILLTIMELIEMYLDEYIETEVRLKGNLKHLIKIKF